MRSSILKNLIPFSVAIFGCYGCTFDQKVEWYDHVREGEFRLVDQVAQPYMNTFFINADQYAAYRTTTPSELPSKYREQALTRAASLRSSIDTIASFPGDTTVRKPVTTIVDRFLTGYIQVDFGNPVDFGTGNGRNLSDDAFDVMFNAVVGRTGVTDAVPTVKELLEERNKDIPDTKKQPEIGVNFDAGFPFLKRRSS